MVKSTDEVSDFSSFISFLSELLKHISTVSCSLTIVQVEQGKGTRLLRCLLINIGC